MGFAIVECFIEHLPDGFRGRQHRDRHIGGRVDEERPIGNLVPDRLERRRASRIGIVAGDLKAASTSRFAIGRPITPRPKKATFLLRWSCLWLSGPSSGVDAKSR